MSAPGPEPRRSDSADGEANADRERVRAIDEQLAHVWMVRTFLKHSAEAEDDEDLREVVRDLYDFVLALGAVDDGLDVAAYLKQAKKKLKRLKRATELFEAIQPEVSMHTNFVMAARSLRLATDQIIGRLQVTSTSVPPGDLSAD